MTPNDRLTSTTGGGSTIDEQSDESTEEESTTDDVPDTGQPDTGLREASGSGSRSTGEEADSGDPSPPSTSGPGDVRIQPETGAGDGDVSDPSVSDSSPGSDEEQDSELDIDPYPDRPPAQDPSPPPSEPPESDPSTTGTDPGPPTDPTGSTSGDGEIGSALGAGADVRSRLERQYDVNLGTEHVTQQGEITLPGLERIYETEYGVDFDPVRDFTREGQFTERGRKKVAADQIGEEFDVDVTFRDVERTGDGYGPSESIQREVSASEFSETTGADIDQSQVSIEDGEASLTASGRQDVAELRFEEQFGVDFGPSEIQVEDGEASLTEAGQRRVSAQRLSDAIPGVDVDSTDIEARTVNIPDNPPTRPAFTGPFNTVPDEPRRVFTLSDEAAEDVQQQLESDRVDASVGDFGLTREEMGSTDVRGFVDDQPEPTDAPRDTDTESTDDGSAEGGDTQLRLPGSVAEGVGVLAAAPQIARRTVTDRLFDDDADTTDVERERQAGSRREQEFLDSLTGGVGESARNIESRIFGRGTGTQESFLQQTFGGIGETIETEGVELIQETGEEAEAVDEDVTGTSPFGIVPIGPTSVLSAFRTPVPTPVGSPPSGVISGGSGAAGGGGGATGTATQVSTELARTVGLTAAGSALIPGSEGEVEYVRREEETGREDPELPARSPEVEPPDTQPSPARSPEASPGNIRGVQSPEAPVQRPGVTEANLPADRDLFGSEADTPTDPTPNRSPLDIGLSQQMVRRTLEEPRRQVEIADEEAIADLDEEERQRQIGDILERRQEQFDPATGPVREFPTGREAVVGREVERVEEAQSTRTRVDELGFTRDSRRSVAQQTDPFTAESVELGLRDRAEPTLFETVDQQPRERQRRRTIAEPTSRLDVQQGVEAREQQVLGQLQPPLNMTAESTLPALPTSPEFPSRYSVADQPRYTFPSPPTAQTSPEMLSRPELERGSGRSDEDEPSLLGARDADIYDFIDPLSGDVLETDPLTGGGRSEEPSIPGFGGSP